MTGTEAPRSVKLIGSPAASALVDLAAIFEDLQTVLMCCERLVDLLASRRQDPLQVEALWTTALLSYARCFTPGERGMGLTEEDITATELQGEVLPWHKMLRQLRKHYTDPAANPRESFSVGVAVVDGTPSGVAITSTRTALPDETSVRQTGALAYALSQLVDRRIGEHQGTVLEGAKALTAAELETLDEVSITEESVGEAAPGDSGAPGSTGNGHDPGRAEGTS